MKETIHDQTEFIPGMLEKFNIKNATNVICSHKIKRRLLLGRKVMTNLDSIFKSRNLVNKALSSQGYGFPRNHVWMWELDCEES